MKSKTKTISKSRFVSGLYCPKRAWLEHHRPLPYVEKEDPLIQMGNQIGDLAHQLYPEGVLIAEKPWQREEAEDRTRRLMEDENVSAIFEAAFSHEGIAVRVDILERKGDAWSILEVKSSTSVKDIHVWDIGVQTRVILGAGVSVSGCYMVLVDTSYELPAEGLNPHQLLKKIDVSDLLMNNGEALEEALSKHRNILALENCPDIEPGFQCKKPWPCDYWGSCTEEYPDDWIINLPRLKEETYLGLRQNGYLSISDLAEDPSINSKYREIARVLKQGQPYLSPSLASEIESFGPPAIYLDFETTASAIPVFAGTRPYQAIPFQWSAHFVDDSLNMTHDGFLGRHDKGDPRRDFVETLLLALGNTQLPIIVYSSYERTVLRALTTLFPDLEKDIQRVIARLKDLLVPIKSSLCHPRSPYSNSIKSIAPALAPDFSYDDLDTVSDGSSASWIYSQLVQGKPSDRLTVESLRKALWRYCERDTLAMVVVHKALLDLIRIETSRA